MYEKNSSPAQQPPFEGEHQLRPSQNHDDRRQFPITMLLQIACSSMLNRVVLGVLYSLSHNETTALCQGEGGSRKPPLRDGKKDPWCSLNSRG